ncbi:MAG TPA: hypothetical protein VE684_21825 [Crenalkalicoccus sp.]|jgi:hypothetical protein|nr:hypothetical protein [Crenalkalicoccus sp.]
MAADARHELTEWLIRHAFDPVLHARAEGRSEADRRKLEQVQKATRAEIERYRNYGSAEEVVTNFKRDLHSAPAKRVHEELRALGLPALDEMREAFERRARELGVGR